MGRAARNIVAFALATAAALLLAHFAFAQTNSPASTATPPPPPPPPRAGIQEEDLSTEPPRPDEFSTLEQQAAQAYGDGNLDQAIALYKDLGERHPRTGERPRFLVTAAWLTLQQGKRDDAAQLLGKAFFISPDFAIKADVYNDEFNALAQDSRATAISERGRTAGQKIREAVQALASEDLARARKLLEEALALAPNHALAVYNLAIVDLRTTHEDAALAGFEKVIALERTQPQIVTRSLKGQALTNLGTIYFSRGQLEDAEAALAQAVAADPSVASGWDNLGLVRWKLGRKPEAVEAFRKAHGLAPADADLDAHLASALLDTQNWVDAVALLVQATHDHAENPLLWLDLGLAERGLGNTQGATDSLRRAMGLDPDDRAGHAHVAALVLAETELARRNFPDAILAAERATTWRPQEAGAWVALGLARKEMHDFLGARAALERARDAAPERGDIEHNLGAVCLAMGDRPAAEGHFRRAVQLDPNLAEAAAALARLQSANGGAAARSERATASRRSEPVRRDPATLGWKLADVEYRALGIKGVLVQSIEGKSNVAGAGLATDDLIVGVDSDSVATTAQLLARLRATTGKAVSLEVHRGGKTIRLRLALD